MVFNIEECLSGGDNPPIKSIVDPSFETSDPNPNIFTLFVTFNQYFFYGKLDAVEVKWSPRMTLCAGLCRYRGRQGGCSIHLSKPLLLLRSRKDLVETLLHEMIHAYLFVTERRQDRDGHGPNFIYHQNRINRIAGTNITVFHKFHDEVEHYRVHWWRCNGPCKDRSPFKGLVKRSMNRAPGPSDFWYKDHLRSCGGKFIKIKEPEIIKTKRKESPAQKPQMGKEETIKKYFTPVSNQPVTPFAGPGHVLGTSDSVLGKCDANNEEQDKSSTSTDRRFNGDHPLLAKLEKNMRGKENVEVEEIIDEEKKPSSDCNNTCSDNDVLPPTASGEDDEDDIKIIYEHIVKENEEETSGSDSSSSSSSEDTRINTECPACGMKLDGFELDDHLVSCEALEEESEAKPGCSKDSGFLEDDFGTASKPKRMKSMVPPNVECPVCGELYFRWTIERHVEDCLSHEEIKRILASERPERAIKQEKQ